MTHPLPYGKWIKSPGSSFAYAVIGPVCRLYDREDLPWPCCRLSWRTKEPSWNRVGKRFVSDIAASRSPSYSVTGIDQWGNKWEQIYTIYNHRLNKEEKDWWVTKKPLNKQYPSLLSQ